MIATAAPQPTRPFISGAAAARLGRMSPTRLQRLVMLGKIRVQLSPGESPRYAREDVERLRDGLA